MGRGEKLKQCVSGPWAVRQYAESREQGAKDESGKRKF